MRLDGSILRGWYIWLRLLVSIAVLVAGAIEGGYGKSELYGDDISYLDVANMIREGDWRAALNPLWSIGYPLLLLVFRRLFSPTPHGEMAAVFWLNLSIYFIAWVGFLWFLGLMSQRLKGDLSGERAAVLSPFLLVCAGCIFVTVQTGIGRVSTVGPDLLVTCLFFFASGLALKVLSRPTAGHAILWGVVLGLGFLCKAIFLTLAATFFAIAIVLTSRRRVSASLLRAVGVFLLFVVSYSVGLSWALGRPTLGEAGALNYAFHVNHLKHWMGWQGGPKELGSPIHPVRLLRTDPPVFAFGEPFHVTYPPQFNMVYWYQGYRQFFSFRNEIRAVFENLRALKDVLRETLAVTLAVALCFCLVLWDAISHRDSGTRSVSTWVLYLPSVLGVLFFLLVHMEGRYVAGFLCVLFLAPYLALDGWSGSTRSALRTAALVLLVVATVYNSSKQLSGAVQSAVGRVDMQSGGQWAVAEYLQEMGLKAGDKVASVSPGNDIRCAWAYASRVHVVAAIGNDAYDPEHQREDLHLFFDNASIQDEVLELFREQGAVAVVATGIPFDVSSPGWRRVPGSRAWVFRLGPQISAGR